jgi:redox-sensitive bicupin YhaK (pirin superfamily)
MENANTAERLFIREPISAPARSIVVRTHGNRHGPVTRIVSPSDIGELIKPFVFLDYFDFKPTGDVLFPMHPHSGIATITVLMSGSLGYEDTTGAKGTLHAGSVEWMRAGGGIWHDASPVSLERFRGYQIWVALTQALENAPPQSQYLPPESVPHTGPARIVLGSYLDVQSHVAAPSGMNLLHVQLKAGDSWRYEPPVNHNVAWAHVNQGVLRVFEERLENELAVFSESEQPIELVAERDADFIIASAVKHPHELFLGYYSVHSSRDALGQGEAEIVRIGQQLRAQGRIR